jgi:hypothetical protein
MPIRRFSIRYDNLFYFQSAEPTPREQEDPNKKLHDERLAESHRRMFDELALLEQRRKVSFDHIFFFVIFRIN